MPLALPPKNAPATSQNVAALQQGLTSVIAGHPGSIEPWTFYEELDAYLGPWGMQGYPIGYGKFYCMAFNGSEELARNPQTREWVRKTTVALQEPLRDLVVQRFRASTLTQLTQSELRAYAFSVHPQAYTQGGLTMVVLTAPQLLPIIATIPYKEFSPASENFGATVKQVAATIDAVLPQAAGTVIAAMMPAHSGLLVRAAQRDAQRFRNDMALNQWLANARRQLDNGELDSMALLTRLTERLNATQFNDQGLAATARQVVAAADTRKRKLAAYYRAQIAKNPSLALQVDRMQPGWRNW